MVIFLYRPEYYGIMEDDAGNSVAGTGEVIVAKNRSGSLDTVKLKFIGKYTKFMDLDSEFSTKFSVESSAPNQVSHDFARNKVFEQLGDPPF
jgi:replicative DNA helicase